MSATAPFDVYVISHTHWDREWYLPLGRFRQRLVALVDELLDMGDTAPRFLLDGQAIVLEDYLAVRPERAAELGAALRSGRLEAGPWYVLADELIPSGEALVRNLLAGRRALRALRAESPPVLYCPDSFGHPAILPLLAHGFGFSVVIAWRGYGGARWPAGDAAHWRSPDGSHAVLYHLPRSGYEFGANLPAEEPEAARRWQAMRLELGPRARLGLLLVLNGADHHALQSQRARAVRALETVASPDRVIDSGLGDFARAISSRAAATELPAVTGELRDSYGYTWVLQGTFAARAHEKRANARVERLLLRDAEPWAALARMRGGSSRRHLVQSAWRTVLRCHPHDTLCGCSTDDVARAMEARLDEAGAEARGIRHDALLEIIGHDEVSARTNPEGWRPVLLLRNRAPRPRGGVADVQLSIPLRHIPVGPGSGTVTGPVRRARTISIGGGTVPLQVLSRERADERVESPRHYPRNELVERISAVAWVSPVDAYGTRAHAIEERRGAPLGMEHPVVVGEDALDNGLLRIAVSDGVIGLEEAARGRTIGRLLDFDDIGEAGDLYTHSGVEPVAPPASIAGVRVIHRGPLRGTLELRWRVPVAPALTPERRRTRTRRAPLVVVTRLTLDAGSSVVRVGVRGENTATDHRLRIRIGTDVAGGDVFADAAFGPVHRVPIVVPPNDTAMETPPRTAPLHRYVTRSAAPRGATLYSDGLSEYEACEDGAFAVTLVRAVGALSRNDIPERPGHAGWPTPTPGAQCLGQFAAELALLLHGARDAATIDLIERTADDVLLPLTGGTIRSALAIPDPTGGIELRGSGLAFSTATESDDGNSLVLRCVNLLDQPVNGAWRLGFDVREARRGRLDETPQEALEVRGREILFTASPREVVTVLVR